MFILIPAIFIFLLLSYLYLNEVSLVVKSVIYILIIVIVLLSFLLYKKIKSDIKLQEINALDAEVIALQKRLENTEDDSLKERYKKQIDTIKKEINSKL